MGDWDDERGRRTSVLGRVDWSCWLAVVGLLFVTVVSFVVQFAAMGIVAIVIAILLVAFDSFVNRPGGIRGRRRAAAAVPQEDWSEVRESPRGDARPPSARQHPQAPRTGQPGRPAQNYGRPQQQAQPRRAQPPRPNSQPVRQPQAPRPNQAQPQRAQPNRAAPGQAQPGRPMQPPPTRANQPQPFRPQAPPPSQGREPDYRARA
jgi:hypothetical protein